MLDVFKVEFENSDEEGLCGLRISHSEKGVEDRFKARLVPDEEAASARGSFPHYIVEVASEGSLIAVGTLMRLVFCRELGYGALAPWRAEPERLANRLLMRLEEQSQTPHQSPPDPPHDGRDLWAV